MLELQADTNMLSQKERKCYLWKKVMMIHLYKDFRQNNQIQGGILLGVQTTLTDLQGNQEF